MKYIIIIIEYTSKVKNVIHPHHSKGYPLGARKGQALQITREDWTTEGESVAFFHREIRRLEELM